MTTNQWKRVQGRRSILAGTRLRTGPVSDFMMALIVRPLSYRHADTSKMCWHYRDGPGLRGAIPTPTFRTWQLPCQAQRWQEGLPFPRSDHQALALPLALPREQEVRAQQPHDVDCESVGRTKLDVLE